MTVRILGAGLSGLSCAINLAKKDCTVSVYEKRGEVGEQIKSNLQGIGFGEKFPAEFFREYNLKSPSVIKKFKNVFLLTPKRDLTLRLAEPYNFVVRGGRESLEYGLYKEAEKLGVEFIFNSKTPEEEVDVIASGPKKADCVAVGGLYENTSFPKDTMLIMFDDHFSPNGWYFYMLPYSTNLVEAVNCVPRPHTKHAKTLFEKALKERDLIAGFMENARLVESIAGYGNAFIPKQGVRDGRLYVGEAAGFQDPTMGFGIEYALKSGYLAAKSISEGWDYESLWRKEILPEMKKNIARRFVLSFSGSKLIEYLYRNYESGQVTKLPNPSFPGFAGRVLVEFFYRLGWARKRFLGHW